jgi:TRAP transporter TAXI family solute receptor
VWRQLPAAIGYAKGVKIDVRGHFRLLRQNDTRPGHPDLNEPGALNREDVPMQCGYFRLLPAFVAAAVLVSDSVRAEDIKLPSSMVWSSYDLGSAGHAEASGIANALQQKFNVRVRIVPSGTSIGRLLPMLTGKVRYGFLATEAFFAAEGTYDFAVQSWGPQDLRVLMGRPASVGLATAKDANIKTIADIKGKRLGYVKGNPSVNSKCDAFLAFAGLTRNDVQVVWFGSYGAQKDAIIANQLDAMISATASSNMRQIEASPRGIYWPEFSPDDKKGWEGLVKLLDFMAPYKESKGAGISPDKPIWLVGFRYPVITTYASTSVDEVYNLVKAIDQTYDLYKSTTANTPDWAVEKSIVPPADAPWHDGAIKYAKEKGLWTKEAEAWQERRLARLAAARVAWDQANEDFAKIVAEKAANKEKFNADQAWPDFWEAYRQKHLN